MARFLFLTGTRADFGKQKSLISSLVEAGTHTVNIFVTGMHLHEKYGSTYKEVLQVGAPCYLYTNFQEGDQASVIVANTINGLNQYLRNDSCDFIVVHGDRPEALAGAIVGAFNNIRVIHIEGGELSGTIDESIRHAVTKFAHIHLVSNVAARQRLIRLGEARDTIFPIGSPELDLFSNASLPSLESVQIHYGIPHMPYVLFAMHPVTTENPEVLGLATRKILSTLLSSTNYFVIAISPNNDFGSGEIQGALEGFIGSKNFKLFPSIRFEAYITLLRNSLFIIGNSSSVVREAPFLGTPSICIGTRQKGRSHAESIFELQNLHSASLLDAIDKILRMPRTITTEFGDGNASKNFLKLVGEGIFDTINIQKYFSED